MSENNLVPEQTHNDIEGINGNNGGYSPHISQAVTRMDIMAEIILGNLLRVEPSQEIDKLTHKRATNDDNFR